MADPVRKHLWQEVAADADGDSYRYCTRRNCGVIWSHMHDQNNPEPVGCRGMDVTRPNPMRVGRRHYWKSQIGVDKDTYFYCRRTSCGVIWSPVHDGNKPEPWGCQGQGGDPPPRGTPVPRRRSRP